MDRSEHGGGPRVREDGGSRASEQPLALVLHDDARMVEHIASVVATAGLEPRAVDSPFRMLESLDRPVALVVIGAGALEDRDLELVPLVRERYARARLLVLHPATLRERAAAALVGGADATLPEPYYPSELAAHARHAVARSAAKDTASTDDGRAAPEDAPVAVRQETIAPSDDPTPIEQLALGVAHGVNNPLQILELMLGTAEPDEPLDIDGIRAQLDRIRAVADDLARVGFRQRMERSPVDVNALVRDTFGDTRRRSDARCEIELDGDELIVQAEPSMLREALDLLRQRAMRVTPKSGSVHVATERTRDAVEIRVTDGGPELRPDERARFFQPQPDPDVVQEGTWLEMAVLTGIVRNHGGSTAVIGDDEGRTIVVVRLPGEREPAMAR